jgi:hypothetical protein
MTMQRSSECQPHPRLEHRVLGVNMKWVAGNSGEMLWTWWLDLSASLSFSERYRLGLTKWITDFGDAPELLLLPNNRDNPVAAKIMMKGSMTIL